MIRGARRCRALVFALLLGSFSTHTQAEVSRSNRGNWSRIAAESWLERAQVRARRGDTVHAITAYTEALRLDPYSGAACLGLAELRLALGDVREAERLLAQATRIPEVRADALARRAALYVSLQEPELARLDFQTAAEVDPSPARLRALASFYLGGRAWVPALEVYRVLLRRLPEQAPETERREAEDTLAALSALSAEADGAQHDMAERGWVRKALRHMACAREKRAVVELPPPRRKSSVAR